MESYSILSFINFFEIILDDVPYLFSSETDLMTNRLRAQRVVAYADASLNVGEIVSTSVVAYRGAANYEAEWMPFLLRVVFTKFLLITKILFKIGN